ncbi:MAG: YheC/YheD family protein [Bacillota bacterium]|nr:YheC/YheD family protein [Bacillota bacterium]
MISDEAAAALEPMDGMQPCLGILYGAPIAGQPRYGRAVGLFRLLSRLAPHHGLFVFIFTPDDLSHLPAQGRVAGRFFDGRSWLPRLFPVPQVVYDRALAGDDAGRLALARTRARLPATIPFVNSPAFAAAVSDKWLVYRTLSANPDLAGHLPETHLAGRDYGCVAGLCRRLGPVVVKDRRGSRALGVLFVRPAGRGGFELTAGRAGPVPGAGPESGSGPERAAATSRLVSGDRDMEAVLSDLLGSREVLVQRAVERARHEGRHGIELRVVMHRTPPSGSGADPPDRWLRTGMVCRLASPEMPFLALGQEHDERPSLVLPGAIGEVAAAAALDDARRLAREVAWDLETSFGRGGELAVDFLIGADGRPYFLEVNAAPAMLFRATSAERLRRRGAERILRYAAYLASS